MLVILRHAEPRRGESDPELTSAGHRMAREAAEWVEALLPPGETVWVRHTPTCRTRQTAEGVALCLGDRARIAPIDELPEALVELDILAEKLCRAEVGSGRAARDLPTVLVGHHTTLVALGRALGLSRHELDARRFTAGCALERSRQSPQGWRVVGTWAGRQT